MITYKEDTHQYFAEDGRELPSVTALLQAVFPEKFDFSGVKKEVVLGAAEYGTEIHKQVQDWLEGKPVDETVPEIKNFIKIWKENEFILDSCEKLIATDDYAGRLDIKAKKKDGSVWVLDIKTTANKNLSKVQYQVSLYANAEGDVTNAGLIWLHNADSAFVETKLKGSDWCNNVIEAYYNGKTLSDTEVLPYPKAELETLNTFFEAYQKANEYLESFRSALLKQMQELGILKADFGGFTATMRTESTTVRFDSARFKKDYPELAKEYEKISKVSASVVLKKKKED